MKTLLLFVCVSMISLVSFTQNETAQKTENESYTMAEFPGGNLELIQFISENLELPASLKDRKINEKCVVKITVSAIGEVKNVEILKNVPECPECDAEALRIVKLMPNWEPAKKNNRAVPSNLSLPIYFKN